MTFGDGELRLLQAKVFLCPGRMQAGGLCRANPAVESFSNDIPIAPIFARTFQVLWSTCPAHVNGEGHAVIPRHVFWALFHYCFGTYFFFFLEGTWENRFFGDKNICRQGSPACIITKSGQLHNVFIINLSLQKAFLKEISY